MMEAFALYLLKSVAWLSGFLLVFILFLRNERFFMLNRIYLLAGIVTSFFFPLISIHYTVVIPLVTSLPSDNTVASEVQNTAGSFIPDLKLVLSAIYASGVLFVFSLIIRQGRTVFRSIKKSEIIKQHPAKLIRTADCTSAYSFFSYVFVNPSITDIEAREIMNHELVHIRQKHWFDLVLVELLCMLQWFNPLVWIYVRFVRQNHEYLADEVALQRTSDPAIYRAALLNQIVGTPVISLSNSFNYSLNKKRFNMMKNIISSPYRKMKILLILPVFAIVLYAFAKPDYKYKPADESLGNNDLQSGIQTKEVKGTVVQQDGTPMPGANITVSGTTLGTITDLKGCFKLGNFPEEGNLIVSFVGFKSKVLKPVFTSDMIISMIKDTVKYLNVNISTPPPPPPPPPPVGIKLNGDGPPPLYVVDGITMTPAEADKIDPNFIESVSILKDETAINKYGDKARDGAIEITTKKIKADALGNSDVPPPPPPLSGVKIKSENGKEPLVVVDGVIKNIDLNKIDPETVANINVLKDEYAVKKYGEKARDGVVEITTKKANNLNVSKTSEVKVTGYAEGQQDGEKAFVVVEEMAEFPGGGKDAMISWISANLKYPGEAYKEKITGKVFVDFTVSKTGKVKNVNVSKSVHPLLDAEAIRVISSMPDWKPATQGGKGVDVQYKVPVEFKLK